MQVTHETYSWVVFCSLPTKAVRALNSSLVIVFGSIYRAKTKTFLSCGITQTFQTTLNSLSLKYVAHVLLFFEAFSLQVLENVKTLKTNWKRGNLWLGWWKRFISLVLFWSLSPQARHHGKIEMIFMSITSSAKSFASDISLSNHGAYWKETQLNPYEGHAKSYGSLIHEIANHLTGNKSCLSSQTIHSSATYWTSTRRITQPGDRVCDRFTKTGKGLIFTSDQLQRHHTTTWSNVRQWLVWKKERFTHALN